MRLHHLLCLAAVSALIWLVPSADAAPRVRTGTVVITSQPPGAIVRVDDRNGAPVGVTPWRGRLPRGTHTVWIELADHEVFEASLAVGVRVARLDARLQPKPRPGKIEVSLADPAITSGRMSIDGRDVGPAPGQVEVAPGRHLLEVAAPGFQRYSQWLEVAPGERLVIVGQLVPRQSKATLVIDADVADATVLVNGSPLPGHPPLVTEVSGGAHVVEVRRPPAAPYLQRIVIKPGERTIVRARLQASLERSRAARLEITSNVVAEVRVDGVDVGPTPYTTDALAPGQHLVEVSAPGMTPRIETIDVAPGGTLVIGAELEPRLVRVTMVTPMKGASVFVDGELRGSTPWTEALAPGSYEVRVERPGYRPYTETVEVQGDDPVRVAVKLEALPDAAAEAPLVVETAPAPATTSPTGLTTALPARRGAYVAGAWVGYPYLIGARVRTGLVDGPRAVDLELAFKSYLTNWDARIGASVALTRRAPFQIAGYAALEAGLGVNGRNAVGVEAGAAVTLDAGPALDLTARVGIAAWSDRLCQTPRAGDPDGLPDDGPRVCRAEATAGDLMRASDALDRPVTDPRQLQSREQTLLPVLGVAAELHPAGRWSYWLRLDGFPGLRGRPAHRDVFSSVLTEGDLGLSSQIGVATRF